MGTTLSRDQIQRTIEYKLYSVINESQINVTLSQIPRTNEYKLYSVIREKEIILVAINRQTST